MSLNLSVSLVIYRSDLKLLQQTLSSLNQAVVFAKQQKKIAECFLTIVNNCTQDKCSQSLNTVFCTYWDGEFKLYEPGHNLGYGVGHNLAINHCCKDFHLVINPDVTVDKRAVINAIDCIENNPQVGMLTPLSQKANGQKEYLCKSYPSVFVLFLRGFAPSKIKILLNKQLLAYELTELPEKISTEINITSGCFMFFKGEALKSINGFSDKFFLYFEDFDLSIRLKKHWKIAYVPDVKITHYGGRAAKKGVLHIKLFIYSAWQFLIAMVGSGFKERDLC